MLQSSSVSNSASVRTIAAADTATADTAAATAAVHAG